MMLCAMIENEHSVSELVAITGHRQAAVSQQLAALRDQGLVASRRDGRRRLYRHADDKVRSIVERLYEIYCAEAATIGHKLIEEDVAE